MRFDWIKCRVRQHQFTIIFVPGSHNLADFFTKPLPVHNHVSLLPVYVTPPRSTSPACLSAALSNRIVSDSGATHVLLRRSSLSFLRHLFSPAPLPSLSFSLPNGDSLPVFGETVAPSGSPTKPIPSNAMSATTLHSPTTWLAPARSSDQMAPPSHTDIRTIVCPSTPLPFLTGTKLPHEDLWYLDIPPPLSRKNSNSSR